MKNKILAVDDSRMMLRILSGAVEMLGYEPVTAQNGQEALEQLQNHGDEVALIMLDWNMPVMNGIQTLEAIKAVERYQYILEVTVTTESEADNIIRAIQAGAKHYLTKPFTQQDLASRMMECMGFGGG